MSEFVDCLNVFSKPFSHDFELLFDAARYVKFIIPFFYVPFLSLDM